MNGKVMPVTGIRPMFIPILTNAWKKIIPVMPIASAWPSPSRATSETWRHRQSKIANMSIRASMPTKPNMPLA